MLEEIKYVKKLEFCKWVSADNDSKKLLENAFERINEALIEVNGNVKKNFIKIGYYLWAIKRGDLFHVAHKPGEQYVVYNIFNVDSLAKFSHDYFGFSKTTTYSLISIMERFAPSGSDGECLPEFKDYSFSQLTEMVSMSDDELKMINSSMSVREIREIKNQLKADKKLDPNTLPCNEKNSPGKKLSGAPSPVFTFDLKIKKDEFRSHCKNFFEKFNYELKLGDRKQGGYAFAGVFFAYLEEKGFFNVKT